MWQSKSFSAIVLVKTLLYTGVRVSALVNLKLREVDLERCQIRINQGKGGSDRVVPFPTSNTAQAKPTPPLAQLLANSAA
ncbi:tyrosine-type recombinase/integrase [Candidatus Chlorohelix allophototropha]|uniref:Tyrosine-type recombinase/integrase n=1 Tax=Candidatus Chlorohelix allophototropha TaxID=3003348 RepID=A0ABY9B707_9CHLR|nr:tyrosine-type recombinase/integrase [Chloroflexota bacterium L227-S17]